MKIVYLTTSCYEKGGIGRFSRYQIRAIRELYGNSNVRVLSLLGPGEHSLETPIDVDYKGSNASLINKLKFMHRAQQIVKIFSPDCIHAAHINLIVFTNFLAKRYGAKSIMNAYGHEVWSTFKNRADIGIRKANLIMSDCYFTADYLEQNGFRPKGSVPVIWDCVDLERFAKGEPPRHLLEKYGIHNPTKSFNILTLGRISYGALHKGYDRLLEVFSRFSEKITNTQLIFVGGGDYLEELQVKVKKLNLEKKVVFTGRVSEVELTDIYKCATIFSLVSDRGHGRGEGIPLTPLEAMACGIPIIVGNHDGSQEAVVENKNGWVIDPFDLDAHLNVFLDAFRDPDLLKSKKDEINRVIDKRFSFEVFKEKHRIMYSNLNE